MAIDVVAVAKQWLTHDSPDESIDAMAKVVLAASEWHEAREAFERIPSNENIYSAKQRLEDADDALVKTLRGEV